MVHTSILERLLQREVVNLGFSGNARLDPEIAALMAQADASVYVLDPLAKLHPERVDTAMVPFVKIIRDRRPTTPVVPRRKPNIPPSPASTPR